MPGNLGRIRIEHTDMFIFAKNNYEIFDLNIKSRKKMLAELHRREEQNGFRQAMQ